MSKVDAVLFDLDGTLWDSGNAPYEAWVGVIRTQKDTDHVPTIEEFQSIMGLTEVELMEKLFPYLSLERRSELFQMCNAAENEVLGEKGGIAYPGIAEAMKQLSEDCGLAIVSNCGKGYIEAYLKSMGTAEYISDRECFGNTGRPKGENIRLVCERNHYLHPVYVGDTIWDKNAADAAGVPFIYAAYGFGDIPDAEYKIDTPSELIPLIESLDL